MSSEREGMLVDAHVASRGEETPNTRWQRRGSDLLNPRRVLS
ncbi:MAG: hypothetical protein Q8Q09_17100 [Deltaproteobacteria bacterium]|nr:hypothetical protein [Deltaproteobacteria bacterium]